MKNYVFKKRNIIVKAQDETQAKEIYHRYLKDASDVGVAEFLKNKGVKFTKVDGTSGDVIVEFDNEKDWTIGTKELKHKYKDITSIKSGNNYKVLIGDYIIKDAEMNDDIDRYDEHIEIGGRNNFEITVRERYDNQIKIGVSRWSKTYNSLKEIEDDIKALNEVKKKVGALEAKYNLKF